MNDFADVLFDRSTYIGSSDACAILGLSKWATPLDIWRRKIHPDTLTDEDRDKEKIFRRGRLMEPVIRQMAVEDYGLKMFRTNVRWPHPEHSFLRAEIDFETLEGDEFVNNDCKSVSPFATAQWGEEGTDEIPIEYHAQFQFGMLVTGRKRCDVWALFGSDDLVKYVVHRDDEACQGMLEKCLHFWRHHVQCKVPPSPATVPDVEFLMRSITGRKVPANPDILEKIAQYRQAKATAKAAEEAIEVLKFDLADAMRAGAIELTGQPLGKDETASLADPETGDVLCTWKAQSTDRIDVKALREKQPKVAAEFSRTGYSRVLRMAK